MRALSLSLLLLPALVASQSGIYQPKGGEEARWNISPNHVLLWNGAPYMPFGLRIGASEAEIQSAKAAGATDVIVDCPPVPEVMAKAIQDLESAGLKYILCISALTPSAYGAIVEPQAARFTGITSKRTIEFKLPGAEEALVVLAVRRDGTLQNSQRVKGNVGAFSVEVKPPNDLEHVALIYPLTSNYAHMGAWEGFDEHRDKLLTCLKRAALGSGLRGILNPFGTLSTRSGHRTFVPASRLFRFEFEAHLRKLYRSPETTMRAWAMAGTSEKTFGELARMVPLWNGSRGVSALWDPKDNQLYPCELRRSTIWKDIDAVAGAAEARRAERLIASIKKIANVPVVQEWAGWSPLYEGSSHGLDGIAARTYGASPSALAETASRAASSLFRWTRPGWLLSSQVDLAGVADAAQQAPSVLDDLLSMGFRGGFLLSQDQALRGPFLQSGAARSQDMSLAQWTVKPLFFPESAVNPASAMRLPGGAWWLPSPAPGSRIDLGSQFSAYRIVEGAESTLVIWSRQGKVRAKLHMAAPQGVFFKVLDGSNPDPKLVKNGVEATLSEMPVVIQGVDEVPIPEVSFQEMVMQFDALLLEAEKRMVDTTEERFLFKDYLNGYPRSPGGNFALMKAVSNKLSGRLARFNWIEAEAVRESNFSEILQVPGLSGNAALGLRSQISTTEGEFTAEYLVQPRTDEEVECWISARIAPSDRKVLQVLIGGQILSIEGEPVSGYGSGFAWFNLGRTRLGKGQTKLTVRVLAPEGVDLAIDAILLYPGSFRPRGASQPEAITFPSFVVKR